MEKVIKSIKTNYVFNYIDKDTTIVFLHGWGQNIEMMEPLEKYYRKYFNTLILDLPGFGKSSEPEYSWTVYEYVDYLKELFDDLKLKKIIIVGHSFGGRLGLIYSSKYKVEKLVCLASPYCKELNKLPLKTKVYKFLKKVFFLKWIANIMKNYIGSTDYKNASEVMRGILVQSINVDMVSDVKKINCPTLLIWGTNDTAVPINRAYELNKLIKDSGVVEYSGATHYAYLERLGNVVSVLDSFFCVRR